MEITERGARFLVVLMGVLGLLSFVVVRPFLGYVIMALVAAFVLRHPHAWLAHRIRRPRFAAGLFVTVTLVALVAPLAFLTLSLVDDAVTLARTLSERGAAERVVNLLVEAGAPEAYAVELTNLAAANLQTAALSIAEDALPGLFNVFIGLFVFFFILYFGLVDGKRMVDFVRLMVPLREERMDRLLSESAKATDAVFKGEILVALIQGSLSGIGWWLFGYPEPVFWGFVAVVLSIIPWTGAPLLIVPVGAYTVFQGEIARGIGFILFGVILVGFVDNVMRPFIIGRRGKIHPAIVLVGVVGGLAAFGIEGLFLGPLILTLLVAVVKVWAAAAPVVADDEIDEGAGSSKAPGGEA